MVKKYRFGKERYIKQINDIWERQKITVEFGGKKVMSKKNQGLQHRGGKRRKEALFC